MKKKIVRGSMLAVATLSLMIGGNSYTLDSKEQVKETPMIISKAIENNASDVKNFSKGKAVEPSKKDVKKIVVKEDVKEDKEKTAQEITEEAKKKTTTEEVTTLVAEKENSARSVKLEHKDVELKNNQVVANINSFLNIRSEASEDSEIVGKFYSGNVGTIVNKGEQWSLVSSGNAYGYVKNDYLLFGDAAKEYIKANCDQVAKVKAETLNVRADKSEDSSIIDLKGKGDSLRILGRVDDWFKVAVDNKVGYVSSDYVYVDYAYGTAVTIEEERAELARIEAAERAEAKKRAEAAARAEAARAEAARKEQATTQAPTTQAPKQEQPSNQETATPSSGNGQQIANYAVNFVGNPYVYGGTSLTNGADCSGFVQSVYRNFGYSLSRTSYGQANNGQSVGVGNIQPGDLVFYRGCGHVAIYIGGGQVVHASSASTGIKISHYNYSPINKVVRIAQ